MQVVVALQRLNFDNFSAQISQQHAAAGAHHHVGKFDDANPCQGSWAGVLSIEIGGAGCRLIRAAYQASRRME